MRARTRPASLRPIRSRSATSILAIERDAIKLHAVIDEAEAQPLGDLLLELLKLGIDEFEHLAGLDVDQVIVVRFGRGLVARTAVAEIMAIEDAGLLEQPPPAVDGRDRDARIDRPGAPLTRLAQAMAVRS